MKYILFLLLLTSTCFADSVLQGNINIILPKGTDLQAIEPGTSVTLSVTVENSGSEPNPPGIIYIRFAYATPLSAHNHSELFRTEEQILPSIQPNEKVTITFTTQHKWPSIFDFIKYNWAMRQYQAEAVIENVDHTIGLLSIAFTMHYYPGPKHELPKQFQEGSTLLTPAKGP